MVHTMEKKQKTVWGTATSLGAHDRGHGAKAKDVSDQIFSASVSIFTVPVRACVCIWKWSGGVCLIR